MLEIVKIHSCGIYHPWRYRGELNPRRNDPDSKAMMDFKDTSNRGHNAAVKKFTKLLIESLTRYKINTATGQINFTDAPFYISIVPSHRAGHISPALIEIANAVSTSYPNGVLNNCLQRNTTVASAHRENGDRSILGHMSTISVKTPPCVAGCNILLLDDVKTTGGSLSACYHLLRNENARIILPLALLETASYEEG